MSDHDPPHYEAPRHEQMCREIIRQEPPKIDRTVTFGLIFAVLVQTAGGLIWAGAAAARLTSVESQVETTHIIAERLARVEGQTVHIEQSLMRIERSLHTHD